MRSLLLLVAVLATLWPVSADAGTACQPAYAGYKWESPTIYYQVGPGLPHDSIVSGIQAWQSPNALLQFVERAGAANAITANTGSGSYATAGISNGVISRFSIFIDPSLPPDAVRLTVILMMGRIIGLDASPCNSSVMYSAPTVTQPSADDLAAVAGLYPIVTRIYLPITQKLAL